MPKDGYFVTSYTFSKGYIVCVDGKEVAPVPVNKAFLGFPLQKGAHEIQIEFHAPGKSLGAALALWHLCFLIFYNTAYGLGHKSCDRPCLEACLKRLSARCASHFARMRGSHLSTRMPSHKQSIFHGIRIIFLADPVFCKSILS